MATISWWCVLILLSDVNSWISTVVILECRVSKPIRVVLHCAIKQLIGQDVVMYQFLFVPWECSFSIFLIFYRFSLWHLLKTWCEFSRCNPGVMMSSLHPHALWEDQLVPLNYEKFGQNLGKSWRLIDSFRPMHFKTIILGMHVSLQVHKKTLQFLSFWSVPQ